MRNDILRQRIKQDLANFPVEVIDQWVYQEALDYGWPPPTTVEQFQASAWKQVLSPYCLEQWRCAKWEKVKIPFDVLIERMDKLAYKKMKDFADVKIKGQRGLFDYLLFALQNGAKMHEKIIAMRVNDESVKILAGHVYLAVYREYFRSHFKTNAEEMIKARALLFKELEVWLVTHKTIQ